MSQSNSYVMAYLKPPWFTARIFNRLAMAFGIGGSRTLVVTTRATNRSQRIPVVVPEVDGHPVFALAPAT